MRQFKDYKKQYKFKLIILFILILSFFGLQVFAQNKVDLENKINQKSTDISKLENEIKSYQNEINNLSKQKNSLSNTLKQLELNRKKLLLNLSLTENKIEQTELKLQNLSSEIGNKEDQISINTKALKSNFRKIDEIENQNLISLLLAKDNLSEVWVDIDNIILIRDSILDKVGELKQIKGELEITHTDTEKAKKELLALKENLNDDKKVIEQNAKETQKLLTQTKNSESNYQKLLKEKKALKDSLEKELRDYESQLKFILDPNSLPGANILSWPVDNVYITQLFGVTSASKRLYASGSHSGVDFRASIGTPIKSVAAGTVLGTGDTDTTCAGASFGKWILIAHENGLASTYGHLSLIKVSAGQKIERGEIIGYSGNTGHTTGPHLHLTIYVKNAVSVKTLPSRACPGKTLTQPIAPTNAYLDPMFYLPKY